MCLSLKEYYPLLGTGIYTLTSRQDREKATTAAERRLEVDVITGLLALLVNELNKPHFNDSQA